MAEVIVALDLSSSDAARRFVDAVPTLRWVKLGPMLFVEDGPALVREMKERGFEVFLDLKWHDIPSSVAGAVRAADRLGVDLATVHALGGAPMLKEAVEAAGRMRLAAVSVLTSHAADGYWDALGCREPADLASEVVRLATVAVEAGAHGVVTSPWEARAVREAVGEDCWIVVPGIRPAGAGGDDQRRLAQPAAAVAAGATHLVVGRAITRAKNPRAVYEEIRESVN